MTTRRAVLHCDMDCYFAAVEEKFNPALKKIPFAVCGDPEMRHSVVMSKNMLAKKAGVPTGISFSQAKQICPDLRYIKADFPKYLQQTKLARTIYDKYSNKIVPYGMDEAWIDLGEDVSMREAEQIADVIRVEIKYALELSASVGVSYNYIFAKIGSDLNKPNSISLITPENHKQVVWPLPASDLLFVGVQRKKILASVGISTIGDIANSSAEFMGKLLGKAGAELWRFANGDDRGFKPESDGIGSIGNTITPPSDLRSCEEVSAILYLLVTSVCTRLKKHGLRTYCVSLCMRDSSFKKIIRQHHFKNSSDNVNYLFNQAYGLFKKHYKWEKPLRSIGIRAEDLDGSGQLSLFPDDDCELNIDIGSRIKKLTERFGALEIENSAGKMPD